MKPRLACFRSDDGVHNYSAQKSSSDVTMLAQTYCQGEKSANRKNQSLASPHFHGIVRSALHSASLSVFSYMPHPTNPKSKPQARIMHSTSENCRMLGQDLNSITSWTNMVSRSGGQERVRRISPLPSRQIAEWDHLHRSGRHGRHRQ